MLHDAAFHLGLHCLPKYLLRGFPVLKGLSTEINKTSIMVIDMFTKTFCTQNGEMLLTSLNWPDKYRSGQNI